MLLWCSATVLYYINDARRILIQPRNSYDIKDHGDKKRDDFNHMAEPVCWGLILSSDISVVVLPHVGCAEPVCWGLILSSAISVVVLPYVGCA